MSVPPIVSDLFDPDDDPDDDGPRTLPVPFGTLAHAIQEGDYREGDFERGERIHHYRILGRLGQGGMGSVFVAEHVYLGQRVAIKTLPQGASTSAILAERFLREAQALAVLNGPNIVQVLDANVYQGSPYFVTELLVGKTLSAHLQEHGTLTVNQTLDLLEQIGEVLIRQQKAGIVHRDIKPANVFVRENGSFCLIDYSLVGYSDVAPNLKLGGETGTGTGQVLGTPHYMAPEQLARPSSIDIRTDLFGLGITAWESVAGRRVRDATTLHAVLDQAQNTPVPAIREFRPDLSRDFSRILESLTAPDIENRYASAEQFVHDLEQYRYGRRRPYGATRGSAFVAIPFHSAFDPLYEFLQEVCGEAQLAARRVDRAPSMVDIWRQIDQEIQTAAVTIAVFTRERLRAFPNANVVTEAAHARALKRPLIILTTDRAEKLPFDWRNLPVIRYRHSPQGFKALRDELLPRLRQEMRQRNSTRSP
jgi:hypothetical protein